VPSCTHAIDLKETVVLKDLNSRDRALFVVYVLIGLAALVGTQWALVAHLADDRSFGDFLEDPFVNPASTFLALDALIAALAALVFMVVEGNRVALPWLWVYVVLVFAVAVSVAFPLFLAARQVTLARANAPGAVV